MKVFFLSWLCLIRKHTARSYVARAGAKTTVHWGRRLSVLSLCSNLAQQNQNSSTTSALAARMPSSPAMSFILCGGGGDYGKYQVEGARPGIPVPFHFYHSCLGSHQVRLGQNVHVAPYRRDYTSLNNQNINVKFLSLPK